MNRLDENTVRMVYRFLNHQGRGLTELRAIDPRGREPPVQIWVGSEEDFVKVCREWDGKRHQIYVGINPRAQKGGTREDVDWVTSIVLDIDAARPDKKQAATDKEVIKAEKVADRIISDFTGRGFKAPVKCMSGNGWQLWFAIPPINVAILGRDSIEGKLQEFQKKVRTKYEDEYAAIDNIGDLPRVVRVIGTTNLKGGRLSHAVGEFVRHEDPLLRDYVLSLEPPQPPKFIAQPAKLPDDRVLAILNKKSWIKRLYEQGPTDGDRSAADFAVVCHLAKHGVPADQIRDVLLSTSWSKLHDVKKIRDPEKYFRTTYEHALEAVADEIETEKIAKKHDKTMGREKGPKVIESLEVPDLIDVVLTKDGTPAYLLGSEPRLEGQILAEDVIMIPPKPRWMAPTEKALDYLDEEDSDLFDDVENYVFQHVDLPDDRQYPVMAAYAHTTWIYDEIFDSLPFLLFLGPYASGKTKALEVLQRLCWRPVFTSAMTEANIYRPTEIIKPTLLVDEMDLTGQTERGREIAALLRARHRRGLTVMRINPEKKGYESIEWYNVFGPTALASIRDITPDLKSRCLVFPMLEQSREVRREINEQKGQELRDRMLAFKIRNLKRPKDYHHEELDSLKGRLRELFAPIVRIAKICERPLAPPEEIKAIGGAMTFRVGDIKPWRMWGMRTRRERLVFLRKAVIGRASESPIVLPPRERWWRMIA